MQLYEYAVVKEEKRDADDEIVEEAKVLVEPGSMMAIDVGQVQMKLARLISEDDIKDSDRIKIMVRPF